MTLPPKISIITVVRNGEQYIESAIKSIISQTYENIEYIVIDGKSSDGTVEIIKEFEDCITHWISEPDKGIYDAMNKGVRFSTGEWILFINSDDYLLNDHVIEQAVPFLNKCTNLIAYGQVQISFSAGEDKTSGDEWDKLKYRFRNVAMCFPHQGTFHSKRLFDQGLFDNSFKIAGDYDLLLRHLKNNDATFIPVLIAKMRAVGISNNAGKLLLLRETRRVQVKNGIYKLVPSYPWIISAAKLIVTNFIIRSIGIDGKDKLKKILGKHN